MEDVKQALLKAKAELSAGWIQGRPFDEYGGVCLYGALIRACGITPTLTICKCSGDIEGRTSTAGKQVNSYAWNQGDESLTMSRTVTLLAETCGLPYGSLATWNDAPERTHEDVVGLIDRALERLADLEVTGADSADQVPVTA